MVDIGGEFIKMLVNVIGWFIIIVSFVFYVTFSEFFEEVPRAIVIGGTFILLTVGLGMITYRSFRLYKKSKETGEIEKSIRITPFDSFKHDLLALLAFTAVVGWTFFMGGTLTKEVLAHATIAFTFVMLAKLIYKKTL